MEKLSPTVEDYLSLIYVLERDHEPIIGARLAELLNVTPPTVTNTLKRMSRSGLVTTGKKGLHLTKTGRDSACTVVRRHMLTEWMMIKRLPWSKLHLEAHNLEHAISTEVENALLEELGHPQTCPHGNPLPGCEAATASWISLVDIAENEHIIIRRVHEFAEQNIALMEFLESHGLVLGALATVSEVLTFNHTITLRVQNRPVTLGIASARYIFVERRK